MRHVIVTGLAIASPAMAQPIECVLRGTIETGEWDEVNLGGLDFTFRALVEDTTDHLGDDLDLGLFVASEASFDFGEAGVFHADPGAMTVYTYAFPTPLTVAAGFATAPSGFTDGLGYMLLFEDYDFDPNDLTSEPVIPSFHLENHGDLVFHTTNAMGESLSIELLSGPESASFATRIVPAPGAVVLLLIGRHRRRGPMP